jgi:hypothetical protein
VALPIDCRSSVPADDELPPLPSLPPLPPLPQFKKVMHTEVINKHMSKREFFMSPSD